MAEFPIPIRRYGAACAAVACAAAAVAACGPAKAQGNYSQAVVQPLPPPALAELNAAMRDLSRNSGNVPALLRAGWASLDLGDTQSALRFFQRAQAIQPLSGEVKAGLASTALRTGDPITAIRLYGEAEATGTPMARYAADRGLALDLVGNNTAAQRFYVLALAYKADPEVSRRLALSQAIAGNLQASEATLLPLLQRRDLAAFRTRAFALAILGKGEEAVSIAETMLPAQISNRLAPYLRYMPRLTRAQQAAAANLGQFPPASEIGRDDPRIAALSSAAAPPQVASAAPDSRLVPSGKPLGRSDRRDAAPSNRSSDKASQKDRDRSDRDKSAKKAGTVVQGPSTPIKPPPAPPPQPELPPQRVAAAVQPVPSLLKPAEGKPIVGAATGAPSPSAAVQVLTPAPQPSSIATLPAITTTESFPPSSPPVTARQSGIRPAVTTPEASSVSLAEAFAAFAAPPAAARADGSIDITTIKPARETSKVEEPKAKVEEPKPKAKPKPPANPQRFWVQVGTGRDQKALGFSWRRLQRDGGALLAKRDPYTAKWGATRRLLTGPYKTEDEADKAVAALKKKGFDAFEFTSDEGEEVTPLKG